MFLDIKLRESVLYLEFVAKQIYAITNLICNAHNMQLTIVGGVDGPN